MKITGRKEQGALIRAPCLSNGEQYQYLYRPPTLENDNCSVYRPASTGKLMQILRPEDKQ
jgi:hypothetical protein